MTQIKITALIRSVYAGVQHSNADCALLIYKVLTPPDVLLKKPESKGGVKFSTIAQSVSLLGSA